jgi:glycosyltransferase involved in cell wall biosynthesis
VPLYSVESRSSALKQRFKRTPKISIITDVPDVRSIPREIRAIARDERRIFRDFSQWSQSKDDSAACLVWLGGDRVLEGSPQDILKRLHSTDRRSFVIVNTPCVEEVPFLTIEPRIFAGAASTDYFSFRIRFENRATGISGVFKDANDPAEPWAKLRQAISAELSNRGSGIESLLQLWKSRDKLPSIIGALVARNLIAAMLMHQEKPNARKFLEAATTLYPDYAELHYLAALLALSERRFVEAVPLLERAKSCGVAIPGSGGENSYRCDWLLGVIAAQVGHDREAFQRFLAGVKNDPPFEQSLTELLKLRLPHDLIEKNQHVFTRAARRNPQTAKSIFEFLRTHRVFDAAERIERTENRSVGPVEPLSPGRRPVVAAKQLVGIAFEGQFFEHSSLARVNLEIARALISSGEFDIRLEASTPALLPPQIFPEGGALMPSIHRELQRVNLTIRHQWPPNFRRPTSGKLAVILPWEYGGVPSAWIGQINRNIDELWVPSNFVRDVLVRNGVEAERVTVIANGFDPHIFKPDGSCFRPQGSREFIFLFVGGAIPRKGIDLLLDAYKATFEESDQVSLVLLVSGSNANGAYQHNSLVAKIQAACTSLKHPPVLPMFETISDAGLADLYRGADAFVLPYRGEGFCMPLLEAMACGKTVITTAEGPAKEFCDASNSYLISAQADVVLDPPPLGPIVGDFTWFEPSFVELTRSLRHVYENREEAATKGLAAARSTRNLTWQNAASQYADRVRHLCQSQ